MTTPPLAFGDYLAVFVPEDFQVIAVTGNLLTLYDPKVLTFFPEREVLPKGEWEFLARLDQLLEQEDQCKPLVTACEWYWPERNTIYADYSEPIEYDHQAKTHKQKWNIGYRTASESFRSMYLAAGGDPNANPVILKRVN